MAKSKVNYEFKKRLKELASLRGQGTELISIYIPPGHQITEMTNKLREEAGQAMNIKSKQTRKNVTGAIERLLHALKGHGKAPENGIVFFAGNLSRDAGGDKIELYSVEPPEPINIQTYRCDSTFFLDPLMGMLESKEVYGLITVDRREATIAILKGKHIDIITNMGSQVPGKHRAGGQSAVRFERLIEIAANEWFKKVGSIASQAFEDERVKGILVGGPGPTKSTFLNGDYLSVKAKNKIVGSIDTSYTDEFGIQEMMQRAGEVMKDLDIVKEKELINKFMKEASTGGLAAYGEKEVREALLMGKVATLILSEGVEWKRVSFKCPHCQTAVELSFKGAVKEQKCPKCGVTMSVDAEKDLVEDFSLLAESAGSSVEMVSTDTPEGEQFKDGFGGIGAILRFK